MTFKVESSVRSVYLQLVEDYEPLQDLVSEALEEACNINNWIFVHRTKGLESYALKIMGGRSDGYSVDDFYAATIVVPNLRGIPHACDLVRGSFDIVAERPGAETKARPTEFNFDSVRMYCRLKNSVNPKDYHSLGFEIQVKTLLEHAWAKATHEFSYKGSDVSWAKERLSAQIKAILDNADLSILEMENIASSSSLAKVNPQYEELKLIVDFIKTQFGGDIELYLAGGSKRLAEHIQQILRRTNISFAELSKSITAETLVGRGIKTLNLSVYSIVLQSLINQYPDRVKAAFERSPSGRNPPSIVIPKEISDDWQVDKTKFKSIIILGDI